MAPLMMLRKIETCSRVGSNTEVMLWMKPKTVVEQMKEAIESGDHYRCVILDWRV